MTILELKEKCSALIAHGYGDYELYVEADGGGILTGDNIKYDEDLKTVLIEVDYRY